MHILECNYFWMQVSLSCFALFEKIYLSLILEEGILMLSFTKNENTFCCSAGSVKYNKDEKEKLLKTTLCLLSSSNLSGGVFLTQCFDHQLRNF